MPLYGKFASYLRRVLCKTRLIFPRINGPIVPYLLPKITFSSKWVYCEEAVIQELPVGVQRLEIVTLDTPKHHFLCSIHHLLIDSSFRCFLKQMNKVPLLPVITGTFLGLLRMSNMMGLCTHGMRKWVPSPVTSGLTP